MDPLVIQGPTSHAGDGWNRGTECVRTGDPLCIVDCPTAIPPEGITGAASKTQYTPRHIAIPRSSTIGN